MTEPNTKPNPTPFTEGQLRKALQSRHADAAASDIHVLKETNSTNDHAAQLTRDGAPDRSLVIAESQSAGRGRRGNTWNSPAGRDLLFSLVLYPPPKLPAEKLNRLPHLIGVAICRALEEICPIVEAKLKWPNDVYISGKKVAGILVENASNSSRAFSIVGIGINVNSLTSERPEELRTSATSLSEETGEDIDRHQVAAAFLANFHQLYPAGLEEFAEILAVIEERSLLLGAKISAQVGNKEITGKAADFGLNGELVVEVETNGKKKQQILNSADQVRLL